MRGLIIEFKLFKANSLKYKIISNQLISKIKNWQLFWLLKITKLNKINQISVHKLFIISEQEPVPQEK